jgi:hypothetical protein
VLTAARQASNAYRIALSGLASIGAAIFSRDRDGNNCHPSRSTDQPMPILPRI